MVLVTPIRPLITTWGKHAMTDNSLADAKASGIYQILNLVNGKRYIGSAACIRKRWYAHRHGLRNGDHANRYLQRAWSKHGADSFSFEVLESCDRELLVRMEQRWIDELRPEYNLSPTAGSNLGVKMTNEAKRKISERNRGNKYCLGRPVPEITRKRISAANRGKLKGKKQHPEQVSARAESHRGMKRSAETRRRISESRKGQKLKAPRSAEYRAKMSAIHKGRKLASWHMAALQDGRAARTYSDEQRAAIGDSLRRQYESGVRSRAKTEEHRNRIGRRFAKLADEQVREIRILRESGITFSELARRYESNPGTIAEICSGKRYRWVA